MKWLLANPLIRLTQAITEHLQNCYVSSYIVEFIVHITMAYVLVVIYDLGLMGIALVTSFDYFLRFAVLQIFIYNSRF